MLKIILLIFTLSLAFALAVASLDRSADATCIRGDGKPGNWVHLSQCESILQIFNRVFPLTPTENDNLMNSTNSADETGYVCCDIENEVSHGIQKLSTDECGKFLYRNSSTSVIPVLNSPWMALLKFNSTLSTEEFACRGTLIDKRFILTSAQCVSNNTLLSVRLGEHNLTSIVDCGILGYDYGCAPPVLDLDVEKVIIHGQFLEQTGQNDIALVKLKSDVSFSQEGIKPICLPITEYHENRVEDERYMYITGWRSEVPEKIQLETVDREFCQTTFKKIISITQFCAGIRKKDSCIGNSGDPLANVNFVRERIRMVQHGIFNFGSANCSEEAPDIYTKVNSFIPWIAYKIATN